jgi:hypothetical protein
MTETSKRSGGKSLLGALIDVIVACAVHIDYVALSLEIAGDERAEQYS